MPRQKSLVGVIREMVRDEVGNAIQSLLGGISTRRAATNGRRRRRTRGTWAPRWSRPSAEESRGDARAPEGEDGSPPS